MYFVSPSLLCGFLTLLFVKSALTSPVVSSVDEDGSALDKLSELLTDVLVQQVGDAAAVLAEAQKRQMEANETGSIEKRQEDDAVLNVTEVLAMKRGQVLQFVSRQIEDVLANQTIAIDVKKRQDLERQLESNMQFMNGTVAAAKRQLISNSTDEEVPLKKRHLLTLFRRQAEPVNVSVEARAASQSFSDWLEIEERQLNETLINLGATALIASSMAQIEDVTSTDFGFKSGVLQENMNKYLEQIKQSPSDGMELAKGLLASLSGLKDSLEEVDWDDLFEDDDEDDE